MPSFEAKHTDELKAWLVKELEPICDADPEVLSDYVLALLRHDATDGDLQSLLKEQLEDFLAEKTSAFVSKTMSALKMQSYLLSTQRTSTSARPLDLQQDGAGSSRKRTADDEGRRSPAKMQRAPDEEGGSDRVPRGPSSSRGDKRERGPKPACRDFHLRGFCPRGDECRYDHTIPPAAPDHAMNPMMNMQMGPGGQPFAMQGLQGQQMHPMYMMPNQQGFPQQIPGQAQWAANGNMHHLQQGPPVVNGAFSGTQEVGSDLGARLGDNMMNATMSAAQPPFEGSFRGSGRGARGGALGRGGSRGTFEKRSTSNTTLVIENVPAEHLDLIKINDYFKKFGTITNIQIDAETQKALVSYSQPAEAKAAHTSPEVIFNNRFVKVYFQKLDDPGIGVKPKDSPAATRSAGPPLKSNFIPGQTSNKFVRADLPQTKAKEAQEAASKRLDTLMAEQKSIMTTLTTPGTAADEKKNLMNRFSALEGEIKAATEEVRNAVAAAQVKAESTEGSTDGTQPKWKDQRENKQKEQLDRELEALNKSSSGSTTEELKAHLARLQEEAAKLGIDPEAAASGRGGFRGRGRASFRGSSATTRGFSTYNARGRGGIANRATMSLDNRPTKMVVDDVAADKIEEAKEHFKQFGEVNTIEDKEGGGFILHYKARLGGERALRAGLDIPNVGLVKASWLVENNGKASSTATNLTDDANMATEDGGGDEEEGDRDDHFRR